MYPQIEVSEEGHGRNDIHLLVSIPPSISMAECVRMLKSFLGRDIKKRFKFLEYVYADPDIYRNARERRFWANNAIV